MKLVYILGLALLLARPALAQTPTDSAATDLGTQVATFATRYLGTPYVYAGKGEKGFDCSGFLYFVYKNFGVSVPAGSRAYAALGREVPLAEARPGDILVFTGTNSAIREPGHVGIVCERQGTDLKFIHSSSAKTANCVTFNLLSKPSYTRRFLKVVRVLGAVAAR
jgi:cell wall-associated NlpC family hydrolase